MTPEGECHKKHPAITSRGPATDTKTNRNGMFVLLLKKTRFMVEWMYLQLDG